MLPELLGIAVYGAAPGSEAELVFMSFPLPFSFWFIFPLLVCFPETYYYFVLTDLTYDIYGRVLHSFSSF